MSVVTGVLLLTSVGDEDNAETFSRKTADLDEAYQPLRGDVSGSLRTRKHPQFCVYGGGINYFSEKHRDQLIAMFREFPWEWPENAVLILQPEEGDTVVVRPTDPEATPVAP